MFRALNLPVGCGYPTLKAGQWVGSGAVYLDSCLNRPYYYNEGLWYPILDSATIVSLITSHGIDSLARRPGIDSIDVYINGVYAYSVKDSAGAAAQNLQQVTDIGDSTDNRIVTNDSILNRFEYTHHMMRVGDAVRTGKRAYFYGNSVTNSNGITFPQYQGYPVLLSKSFGFTPVIRAISSSTLQQFSVGDSSMEDRIHGYPDYDADYDAGFFMMYAINDAFSSHTFDTTNFKISYRKIIDSLLLSNLWPAELITVLTPSYVEDSGYPNIEWYANAAYNVAIEKGVNAVDVFHFMQDNGGMDLLQSDSIHPNILGAAAIAYKASYDLPFPLVGQLDVYGSLHAKDSVIVDSFLRIGNQTVSGYNLINTGTTQLNGRVWIGGTVDRTTQVNIDVSTNYAGLKVYEPSTNKRSEIYGGHVDVFDASNNFTYLYPNGIYVGSANFTFFGQAGRNLMSAGYNGDVIFNDGGIDSDLRIEGDNDDTLFLADAGEDKIGIGGKPVAKLDIYGNLKIREITNTSAVDSILVQDAGIVKYVDGSSFGGGGTPGGPSGELQWNNAGSFGGIAGATTNGTVVTLTSPVINVTSDATGDIYYRNAGGLFTRLALGTAAQVLTVNAGATAPEWAAAASGFANPMTTAGDIILGGASGTPTRLGIGANTFVLTSNGTTASWAAASGGGDAFVANPLSQFAATTSAQLASVISDEVGTDKLVYNTSPGFATAINPISNDGAALGTTALQWSDLFLASGSVVNFNNGDMTLTHSSNLLTSQGGNFSIGSNFLINAAIQTGSSLANSNMYIGAASNATNLGAGIIGSGSTMVRSYFLGQANTLTANLSYANIAVAGSPLTEASSGTHDIISTLAVIPAPITGAGATTTDATNVYIKGAPTGITPTNPATALWVASGPVRFGTTGTATGTLLIEGATSGSITIQPQAAAGTYNFNLPTTAGNAGEALISGGGGATAMTYLALASSNYTPTIANGANVDASTAYDLKYTRVGDKVHVFGKVDIDATVALTNTTVEFTLPVASNIGAVDDAIGNGGEDYGVRVTMYGNVGADRIVMHLLPTGTGNTTYYFSFDYVII